MRTFNMCSMAAGLLALAALAGPSLATAQQNGPLARGGTELGNFGDLPYRSPNLLITSAENRSEWRSLEDKHLKELRDFEDKFAAELRALRQRQAEERDRLLRKFE